MLKNAFNSESSPGEVGVFPVKQRISDEVSSKVVALGVKSSSSFAKFFPFLVCIVCVAFLIFVFFVFFVGRLHLKGVVGE